MPIVIISLNLSHLHRPQLTESEKEHIRGCHLSRRRLEEDDIPRVSRRFGAGWRDVGNSLHFTHAQLDQVTKGASIKYVRRFFGFFTPSPPLVRFSRNLSVLSYAYFPAF